MSSENKNFIALDIDGTIATHDGNIHEDIQHHVRRVSNEGHYVVLATGRSPQDVLPIVNHFNIYPEFLVCVNGAVVLKRDPTHSTGYAPLYVESFNPTHALDKIKQHMPDAKYAVEVHDEGYHYTEHFDIKYVEPMLRQAAYDEILKKQTIRAIVVSDAHSNEDFHNVVNITGIGVVGHAPHISQSWIEIFADGVHKAAALEKIRQLLNIHHTKVVAVGDGYNDIQMLQWAARGGRSVAMGQAHKDVKQHATEVAPPVTEAGVAWVLQTI